MSLQDDSRRKDSAMPMPGAGDIAQGMHADGISGEIADGRKGNHAGHAAGTLPGGDMARYFAREGVDPLTSAFDGKIAVHPGAGGEMLNGGKALAALERLLDAPREGRSVAYVHVPFYSFYFM